MSIHLPFVSLFHPVSETISAFSLFFITYYAASVCIHRASLLLHVLFARKSSNSKKTPSTGGQHECPLLIITLFAVPIFGCSSQPSLASTSVSCGAESRVS